MAYMNVKEGRTESQGVKGKKLTPKMLSFIDAYFGKAAFNATEAMKMSAYKTTRPAEQAAELMCHPLVIKEIARRQAARSDKAEVKAEWLVQKLMNIVANTEEDNPQAAIRAIELLGKTIAIWRDKQEISGPDGAAIQHEQKVKQDVESFTSRISQLAKRSGTGDVVVFPNGRSESGS